MAEVCAVSRKFGNLLNITFVNMQKFRGAFRPNSEWGPADAVLKKQYVELIDARVERVRDSKGDFISRSWNKVFGE